MSLLDPPPPQLSLILWTTPEARPTFRAVASQAGWRRIVETKDDKSFMEAIATADSGVALIDEHCCASDPLHLIVRRVRGEIGELLPFLILMTSEPTRATVETALLAGFDSVIAKPFSAQTLAAHTARAVAFGSPPLLRDDQIYVD